MGLMHFVGAPYMLEFFTVPANSMAPAVVGWHYNGICPQCGQTCFVSAPDPDESDSNDFRDDRLGICTACRQTGDAINRGAQAVDPDRICVNKLLRPKRWDIIEFRFPPNPQVKYIKRLVGLPGETIFIEDGAVWINGERQPLPSELAGLKYSDAPAGSSPAGTRDDPWNLLPREYFVLGDFSDRSSDSRYWGPVPRGNIEGVVTLRYWPPSRWHIFR
jgi:signal peptidase I